MKKIQIWIIVVLSLIIIGETFFLFKTPKLRYSTTEAISIMRDSTQSISAIARTDTAKYAQLEDIQESFDSLQLNYNVLN